MCSICVAYTINSLKFCYHTEECSIKGVWNYWLWWTKSFIRTFQVHMECKWKDILPSFKYTVFCFTMQWIPSWMFASMDWKIANEIKKRKCNRLESLEKNVLSSIKGVTSSHCRQTNMSNERMCIPIKCDYLKHVHWKSISITMQLCISTVWPRWHIIYHKQQFWIPASITSIHFNLEKLPNTVEKLLYSYNFSWLTCLGLLYGHSIPCSQIYVIFELSCSQFIHFVLSLRVDQGY